MTTKAVRCLHWCLVTQGYFSTHAGDAGHFQPAVQPGVLVVQTAAAGHQQRLPVTSNLKSCCSTATVWSAGSAALPQKTFQNTAATGKDLAGPMTWTA